MQLDFEFKWIINSEFIRSIRPNLKDIVYCVALREGGLPEWKFAHKQYLETSSASERETLLTALGCTQKPWLLSK